MTKTLKTLGIDFGRKHIATNGNFYRVAKPTEEFWSWYKENKEDFKQNGYSVYKHNEYGFCVYDWTNKIKATNEEILAYNKEKLDYEKHQLQCSLQDLRGYVQDQSDEEVEECETWEELKNEIDRFFDNPNYVWNEYIVPNMIPDFYWT